MLLISLAVGLADAAPLSAADAELVKQLAAPTAPGAGMSTLRAVIGGGADEARQASIRRLTPVVVALDEGPALTPEVREQVLTVALTEGSAAGLSAARAALDVAAQAPMDPWAEELASALVATVRRVDSDHVLDIAGEAHAADADAIERIKAARVVMAGLPVGVSLVAARPLLDRALSPRASERREVLQLARSFDWEVELIQRGLRTAQDVRTAYFLAVEPTAWRMCARMEGEPQWEAIAELHPRTDRPWCEHGFLWTDRGWTVTVRGRPIEDVADLDGSLLADAIGECTAVFVEAGANVMGQPVTVRARPRPSDCWSRSGAERLVDRANDEIDRRLDALGAE